MSASFALFDTPIGTCSLVWQDRTPDPTIVGLRLPEQSAADTRARIKRRILEIEGAAAVGAGPLFAGLQQRNG